MNNYYFKKEKAKEFIVEIKNSFMQNRKSLEKAFKLDYKEWEFEIKFENLIKQIEQFVEEKEYLPVFSKGKIVDGMGKIVLISNQNPYLILNFILAAIYTNNKVEVILERKMLATNKSILETILKVVKGNKYDLDTISYIEVTNKEEVIYKQENYDLLYFLGNKEEYIDFTKRINIDTKFENFGEIYIFADSQDFQKEFAEIDEFAISNEIKLKYFNLDFEKSIEEMNKKNNICKLAIIFTKDIDKAYEFIKSIKAEEVFINKNPFKDYKYDIKLDNLIFKKIVKL